MNQPRPDNPWLATRNRTGGEYDAPYEQRAAAGEDVHGEATFVQSLGVRSVLDAGCGTGRIARELHRRGLEVVGVDLDDVMLDTGRKKAPEIEWHTADLETLELRRTFDAVLMAGNVMIFLTPGSEEAVVRNMARHLASGGLLIAGFQLDPERLLRERSDQLGGAPVRVSLERFDRLAEAAGLSLHGRFGTWRREPWVQGGGYAVSVMRKT